MKKIPFLTRLLERWAQRRLARADIILNGSRPWDIEVRDPQLFYRVLFWGSLAFGEEYQRGTWDTKDLPECIRRVKTVGPGILARLIAYPFHLSRRLKLQTRLRARVAATEHYDLDNEFYKAKLGETMQYSCAYFGWGARELTSAQKDKMCLIGLKLELKPGMRVLDVGCGFGTLARFLAEQFNVSVVAVTLSEEQATYAREICARLPVEIRVMDYRDVCKHYRPFDRIVSVGMFEHVGAAFYRAFMQCMYRCLKGDGIFLLHTIVGRGADRWINKYIFPYGILPARSQIERAIRGLFFPWDWHELGKDYARTLRFWRENFVAAWPRFEGKPNKRGIYDRLFYRTWTYYLAASEGLFAGEHISLCQVVLGKHTKPAGYEPIR